MQLGYNESGVLAVESYACVLQCSYELYIHGHGPQSQSSQSGAEGRWPSALAGYGSAMKAERRAWSLLVRTTHGVSL